MRYFTNRYDTNYFHRNWLAPVGVFANYGDLAWSSWICGNNSTVGLHPSTFRVDGGRHPSSHRIQTATCLRRTLFRKSFPPSEETRLHWLHPRFHKRRLEKKSLKRHRFLRNMRKSIWICPRNRVQPHEPHGTIVHRNWNCWIFRHRQSHLIIGTNMPAGRN